MPLPLRTPITTFPTKSTNFPGCRKEFVGDVRAIRPEAFRKEGWPSRAARRKTSLHALSNAQDHTESGPAHQGFRVCGHSVVRGAAADDRGAGAAATALA